MPTHLILHERKNMNKLKIFFDLEFTGLHQFTSCISLGIVDENNNTFYAEFDDFNFNQVDSWLETNVMANLLFFSNKEVYEFSKEETYIKGSTETITEGLIKWLNEIREENQVIEIWGDCLAYDWVLLCQLFKGALNIPSYLYYIPFDICTLFKIRGIDPDISREEYAQLKSKKHNSLDDALIIKTCFERLTLLENI